MLTIEGKNFGSQWLTNRPSKIGGVEVGKLEHTGNLVELVTPSLPQGVHKVELFIEGKGLAVLK